MSVWDIVFGPKGQLAVAGAMGGLVKWLTLRDHWADGVISIVVGAICAIYVSPLALPIIDPFIRVVIEDPQQRSTLSGFIIGMGGIGFVGFIMDIFRFRKAELREDEEDEEGNNDKS